MKREYITRSRSSRKASVTSNSETKTEPIEDQIYVDLTMTKREYVTRSKSTKKTSATSNPKKKTEKINEYSIPDVKDEEEEEKYEDEEEQDDSEEGDEEDEDEEQDDSDDEDEDDSSEEDEFEEEEEDEVDSEEEDEDEEEEEEDEKEEDGDIIEVEEVELVGEDEEGEEKCEDDDEEELQPLPKRIKCEQNSYETSQQVKCQMCDTVGHRADECPKAYTICEHCHSSRVISISKTPEHLGEKFFACQFPIARCKGPPFPWVNDYIEPSYFLSKSSYFTTYSDWIGLPCRDPKNIGCTAKRKLQTSIEPGLSRGKRFLKCDTCGDFQWLHAAIFEKEVARDKSCLKYWAKVFP